MSIQLLLQVLPTWHYSRYAGSSQFGKMGYEDQFLDCLEKTIRDLDKRIQRGKERLARSAEANKKVCEETIH